MKGWLDSNPKVAPLAGAWIEIQSHTFRAWPEQVAPLAGAWIEIEYSLLLVIPILVAPLAGAWIEMIKTES